MRWRWMTVLGTIAAAGLLSGCAAPGGSYPGSRTSTKPDMAPCTTNADCRVPAYVSVGPNGECRVQMLVETVTIAQGRQPMVVWRLEKADPDGDHHDYRFAAVGGVRILNNDRATDFDQPGYMNGNQAKFMWRSLNRRRMGFDYTMAVQRRVSADEPWSDCALLDPRIVNEGP